MVQNIQDKHLDLFKIIELLVSAIQKVRDVIIADIMHEKEKYLDIKVLD